VVAYSNAAKSALLGVPAATLEEHGAVSDLVVRAMAEGVRERFNVDIGIATTGISGPDGGTDSKPVGLVHIALAREAATYAESFVFRMDRTRHRLLTSQIALDWVRRTLLGVELVGPKWAQR
jgi:PncC family amidohydrolase